MNSQPSTLAAARPSTFLDEIRIIPYWAYVFAVIGFLCMQAVFNGILPMERNAPPAIVCFFLGLLVGCVVACYILLIGYVNRDAARRGMSRLLWTLLVIFIPNALGFILYFLLRQPMTQPCPQCQSPVQATFNYCPTCHTKLHPHCAQCQRMVQLTDTFCPYCGYKLDDIVH
jgi:RNA polymerase subunit RPABC4/transcription elongation factor Spt4